MTRSIKKCLLSTCFRTAQASKCWMFDVIFRIVLIPLATIPEFRKNFVFGFQEFWPNSDVKSPNGSIPRRSNLSTQAVTDSPSGSCPDWRKAWRPRCACFGRRRKLVTTYVFSNCYSNFWLIFGKLWEARSRLYRSQNLQVNTRLKALDGIYKIYTLLHRSAFKISINFVKRFRIFTILFSKFHCVSQQVV